MLNTNKNKLLAVKAIIISFVISAGAAFAAGPAGNDWFEFHASPFTGGDDTGDGGTGNTEDLNYYYVGQSFNGAISINSSGTTVSNIWVDYDPQIMQASNLTAGDYFNTWQNQTIENGRIKSTGYNFSPGESSGEGNFGAADFQFIKPSAADYGTSSPASLDINIGQVGQPTESNIANNGTDLLDDAEDFQLHIWADTRKPYAKNPQPEHKAADVPAESLFTFELRDSLNGAGDDSGVGTGVNMDSSSANITFDDGSGAVSFKGYAAHACFGIWGSNLCEMTVDAPVITNFAGDTRRWQYGTVYTVKISGYKDLASASQDQLGDANGPNTMGTTTFTFTTETDTVSPELFNIAPESGSADHPLNVSLSFEIEDRGSYPNGISGSGVNAENCRIDVSSASFGSQTFSSKDDEVTLIGIDYGYRFEIDPVADFSSNETVTVRIYDCADNVLNVIQKVVYNFDTVTLDSDGDGVLDSADNCMNTPNADQLDFDQDGIGDACDTDIDGDTILNNADNCSLVSNSDQSDVDGDGIGDVCDTDIDGDTILNNADNCSLVSNSDQSDVDGDGIGDVCDTDIDGDTVLNDVDNCPLVTNTNQSDIDENGFGDVCDDDIDGDTILNDADNCPLISNTDQSDVDEDGFGDICDAGFVTFNIFAKPEKRAIIDLHPNLSLTGNLKFFSHSTSDLFWEEDIALNSEGFGNFSTGHLTIGDYDVVLKGENNLGKIVRNISIVANPEPMGLDYAIGGTFELLTGDIHEDDRVSSFDISQMLFSYGKAGSGPSDLNKDGRTSAPDIAILILNYFKQGDTF